MRDEDRNAPPSLSTEHVCEGGDLDCGSGLLLLIKKTMAPVPPGEVLEIRSTEISVKEDLPAWCRMTSNPYLGWRPGEGHQKYFVERGGETANEAAELDDARAREYRWQARARARGVGPAEVFCRNHAFAVGQPASFDVSDEAPSAIELVLGALGACLAAGLRIRSSQRGLEIGEIEIQLAGRIDNIFVFLGTEEEGHPGLAEVTGTLYVDSLEDEAELQALFTEVLAASPVAQSLGRRMEIDVGLRAV